jgi:hypothetical protein
MFSEGTNSYQSISITRKAAEIRKSTKLVIALAEPGSRTIRDSARDRANIAARFAPPQ